MDELNEKKPDKILSVGNFMYYYYTDKIDDDFNNFGIIKLAPFIQDYLTKREH
jgi:hypothetical protein